MSKVLIDGLSYFFHNGEYGQHIRSLIDKFSGYKNPNISITKDDFIKSDYKLSKVKIKEIKIDRFNKQFTFKTDIFHCLNNGFYIDDKSLSKNIMSISTIIPLLDKKLLRDNYTNRFHNKIEKALKKSDIIITTSYMQKKIINNNYTLDSDKFIVIYPTVDNIFEGRNYKRSKDYIKFKFNITDNFMFTLFDIRKKKNIEEILTFFSYIKKNTNLPDKLIIAYRHIHKNNYEEEYINSLVNLSFNLGVSNDVIFLENIIMLDEFHLFNTAYKYIDLSITEDFNLSIIKAFVCDTDIICTDIELYRELLGDYPSYYTFCEEDIISLYIKNKSDIEKEVFDFARDKFKGMYSAKALKEVYERLGGEI